MRSNIVSAEAQDIFLTKRALANLLKDDFEVCTRELRNGVKFYQDKEMIEAFSKNPQSDQPQVSVMPQPISRPPQPTKKAKKEAKNV